MRFIATTDLYYLWFCVLIQLNFVFVFHAVFVCFVYSTDYGDGMDVMVKDKVFLRKKKSPRDSRDRRWWGKRASSAARTQQMEWNGNGFYLKMREQNESPHSLHDTKPGIITPSIRYTIAMIDGKYFRSIHGVDPITDGISTSLHSVYVDLFFVLSFSVFCLFVFVCLMNQILEDLIERTDAVEREKRIIGYR